jgi:hypothetical protein
MDIGRDSFVLGVGTGNILSPPASDVVGLQLSLELLLQE